jgi:hypothetical protein
MRDAMRQNDAKKLICSMAGCAEAGKCINRGMISLQGTKYLQDQRSWPHPAPNSTKRTCANQLNTQRLKISSTMNDTDRKKPFCINWCKKMSKPFLHKLKPKLGRGYPILLKTNLKHFLNVAFWPMGSYACVVPTAPMRNCWRFLVNGEDSVPHVVDGVWRRRLLTWLITSFPGCWDKKYCVNTHGFSLHAGVRCAMNQCKELERLCCYITRPAIANERLTRNDAGQVVLTLKTPYRDGTTHIAMSPLEFMQRLAALVPRPRLNLIRFASFRFAKYLLTPFHGVLAPNAKLRSEIIPSGKKNKPILSDTDDDVPHFPVSARISWGRLLKRVFDIDIEHCPHCGGTLKIVAAILESGAITKILDHLGLPARAPPRAPATNL